MQVNMASRQPAIVAGNGGRLPANFPELALAGLPLSTDSFFFLGVNIPPNPFIIPSDLILFNRPGYAADCSIPRRDHHGLTPKLGQPKKTVKISSGS